MNTDRRGFSVVEALILMIVIASIGLVGWRLIKREQSNSGLQSSSSSLKDNEYHAFLDAATDDGLVNYYKFGLTINLAQSGETVVDPGSGVGPGPCQEVIEDYSLDKTYDGDTLRVKIANYQRVENPKGILDNDPKCKSLESTGEKEFDLDKNWLAQKTIKTISIEGLDNASLVLVNTNYKLVLTKQKETLSTLPYYPDKVAVLIAWGDDCPEDSKALVTQYAQSISLELADPKYPGIETIYRRPKREVNVILAGLKDTDVNKYKKNLGGDCSVITTKPNLHDLSQQGLSYQ